MWKHPPKCQEHVVLFPSWWETANLVRRRGRRRLAEGNL